MEKTSARAGSFTRTALILFVLTGMLSSGSLVLGHFYNSALEPYKCVTPIANTKIWMWENSMYPSYSPDDPKDSDGVITASPDLLKHPPPHWFLMPDWENYVHCPDAYDDGFVVGPILKWDIALAEAIRDFVATNLQFLLLYEGALLIIGVFCLKYWKWEDNVYWKLFLAGTFVFLALSIPGFLDWFIASFRRSQGFH